MAGKYLCPYCYKENKMADVDFRCTNRQCKEENDQQLADYERKETLVKLMTFRPRKSFGWKMPEYAECPECGVTTSIRLCPQCHNPLPRTIDESNDMIISVIGARDSGKSNYIGVLIHELKNRVFQKFDFSFGMIKESQDEYRDRFGRYLYPAEYAGQEAGSAQAHTVPRTEAHAVGASVHLSPPIVCELARKNGAKIERYSLSFLDSAGEDFKDPAAMATVMPYIAHSKGIIFLLDPMQLPQVRSQMDGTVVSTSGSAQAGEVASYTNIISDTATQIRTSLKMKGKKQIDIPVVIAFSKFDALKGIVDAGSRLWKDSPHASAGVFDELDARQVNDEMVGLLHLWGAGEFVSQVGTEFSNVKYMPCSAFGACPDAASNVAPPKSLRLEDGILWIMKELKKIPPY